MPYLIIINIIEFIIMGIDKRLAIKNKYRIPEKAIILLSLMGGALGVIIGMYTFKHKTKKRKFHIIFVLSLIFYLNIIYITLHK